MSIVSKTKIRVRYAETDQMGVVHHGNYAQYLELARIDWLSKLGISYKSMEENGVMLPVFEIELKFKKSAFFDDELIVTSKLRKTPTVRIVFDYLIHNQDGELLTIGSTTLVFVDTLTKKPIVCPEYVMKKIEEN